MIVCIVFSPRYSKLLFKLVFTVATVLDDISYVFPHAFKVWDYTIMTSTRKGDAGVGGGLVIFHVFAYSSVFKQYIFVHVDGEGGRGKKEIKFESC